MHYVTLENCSYLLSVLSLPTNLLLAKAHTYKYAAMAIRCFGNIQSAEKYSDEAIKTWSKIKFIKMDAQTALISTLFIAQMAYCLSPDFHMNAICMASILQCSANVFGSLMFNITTQAGNLRYEIDRTSEQVNILVDGDVLFKKINDPEKMIIRIDDVQMARESKIKLSEVKVTKVT